MVSGRREVDEEKVFTTQLSKALHVTKANIAQKKIIRKADKTRAEKEAAAGSAAPAAVATSLSRRAAKKRARGGSIWITLKGAFASSTTDAAEANRRSEYRSRLTQKRRSRDESRASDYIESAFSQAKEAGLLDTSGVAQSDEAVAYLEEQYEVAANMLKRPAVGSYVASMIGAVCPTPVTSTAAAAAGRARTWAEESALKERTLLQRRYTVGPGVESAPPAAATAAEPVEETAKQLLQETCFVLREPVEQVPPHVPPVDGAVTEDVVPTKCIIKLRSSAGKSTCLLSNQKSVAAFRQNLSLFLKKEVSGFLQDSTAVATRSMKKQNSSSPLKPGAATAAKKSADSDSKKRRK